MATARAAAARSRKKAIGGEGTRSGFTIIEVVLVLAIAGLIFMMVFIALPQLQASQRDTQRKSDLSRFTSAITQYQANNNGKIPNGTDAESTIKNRIIKVYLSDDFDDPSTDSEYKVNVNPPSASTDVGNIDYYTGKICGDTEGTFKTAKARNFAAVMIQEGGSLCEDNG